MSKKEFLSMEINETKVFGNTNYTRVPGGYIYGFAEWNGIPAGNIFIPMSEVWQDQMFKQIT